MTEKVDSPNSQPSAYWQGYLAYLDGKSDDINPWFGMGFDSEVPDQESLNEAHFILGYYDAYMDLYNDDRIIR